MSNTTPIYGTIDHKTDMRDVFEDIRRDAEAASTRAMLTELYRRAGYLVMLTYAPSWKDKFGDDTPALRKIGREEFRKTARRINHQARQIGTAPDYDEEWGA